MRYFYIFLSIFLISCSEEIEKKSYVIKRIKSVSTNSVNYVVIPSILYEAKVYKEGDTVWVNTTTHRIDDSSENITLSIIQKE